jgi:hypothetical protein
MLRATNPDLPPLPTAATTASSTAASTAASPATMIH